MDSRDASSTLLVSVLFAKKLLSTLQNWKTSEPLHSHHLAAVNCEIRALQRALLAMQIAKRESGQRQLNTYESLQLELEHVRCAIWPTDTEIGEETQQF